jgi:glycosyl transferase family 1
MATRISTLFLHANGFGATIVGVDTILRGLLGYDDGAAPPRMLGRIPLVRNAFAELRDVYARLSYIHDWREAFLASPRLDVDVCNINNLVEFARYLWRIDRYELIIISHAAAGDDMTLLLRAASRFDRRRGKLVMFVGNEYDLLDQKLDFIRRAEPEVVCSQLPLDAARYLYDGCGRSQILEMPHALNPRHYYALAGQAREIDIAFRGDIYWPFVGDRERTDLIEWFEQHGASVGLSCDIARERLNRDDWNRFLNRCKAIVGAESGTYYLNERGNLLERARAYNLHENRGASFAEVFGKFYAGQPREVSGKSISSRHFEAIGAKTCQILIEGHYNGILHADRHYIAVKRDLSNIGEAIERFRDEHHRQRMVDETYDYVLAEHTYDRRIDHLLSAL